MRGFPTVMTVTDYSPRAELCATLDNSVNAEK
jgi:hypothetical protein